MEQFDENGQVHMDLVASGFVAMQTCWALEAADRRAKESNRPPVRAAASKSNLRWSRVQELNLRRPRGSRMNCRHLRTQATLLPLRARDNRSDKSYWEFNAA